MFVIPQFKGQPGQVAYATIKGALVSMALPMARVEDEETAKRAKQGLTGIAEVCGIGDEEWCCWQWMMMGLLGRVVTDSGVAYVIW